MSKLAATPNTGRLQGRDPSQFRMDVSNRPAPRTSAETDEEEVEMKDSDWAALTQPLKIGDGINTYDEAAMLALDDETFEKAFQEAKRRKQVLSEWFERTHNQKYHTAWVTRTSTGSRT